ncbi:aspartate aminotransferase family protein [Clostridium sp. YIM B02515]|uniref:Aspartate aminotransferase family protein n=1 Tax=Clostridium rhizosphaerae TaxID=2803861 RepID=A0ABS1T4C6_9CLOT|nr:aspartate aminotransferase family protein [Clostridium rhizosphaerae]MBL4934175.1 aspartate aminotransferase family protein [Clostridium rhizosphaerae]
MFINLLDIEKLSSEELNNLYEKNFSNSLYEFFKLGDMVVHYEKALGMNVWDTEGNKYLDFMGGFGALNLGHNHPRIIEAVKNHSSKPNLLQQSINVYNGVLANNISFLTNDKLPVSFFTNSGAETVEEALKIAYMYYGKGKIVYCTNGYHGKTLGAISALGTNSKNKFLHFEHQFIEIPFGDINALIKVAKKHNIAAFLVEPIQGEGGINLPPQGYFEAVREICNESEIVLILDEIQSGLGRCGTMFCYEQLNIVPDILCLSKSLSGGIMPVGSVSVKQEIWDTTYGKLKNAMLPSTTFGGNTLACIAAIETLTVIKEDKLPERAKELGEYALMRLNKLKEKHEIITEVRGKGLFIGIEFGGLKKLHLPMLEEFMMINIISKMLKDHKILCGFAANNPCVIKFEPPLIVTKEEIDCFAEALDKVLDENKNEFVLAVDTLVSTGKNIIKN